MSAVQPLAALCGLFIKRNILRNMLLTHNTVASTGIKASVKVTCVVVHSHQVIPTQDAVQQY